MRAPSLSWEDPLQEGMATHSSFLAWRSPWTEELGGLQSTESQRAGHNLSHMQKEERFSLPVNSSHLFVELLQLIRHCARYTENRKQFYNLLHFTDDKYKMQRSSNLSKSKLSSELNSNLHLKGSKVCVHLPTMLERESVCVSKLIRYMLPRNWCRVTREWVS